MPYQHTTAFGTTQGNLSDAERLGAQQGMNAQAIAAQMAALNAEIADRQAGRTFQGGQAAQDRTFQSGMFDKNAGLQTQLDQSKTARDLGVVNAQMAPSMMDAGIRQREANVDLPVKEARGAFQLQALKNAMGGMGAGGTGAPAAPGAAAVPGVPGGAPQGGGLDPDATMFMAWGGNPGEYMAQKRQQVQADRTHQDAEDARNLTLGTELMKSTKPEARALGATILAKVKNSGLSGADPSVLQGALTPDQDPQAVIAKSPAMSMEIDNAATLLNNASHIGGNAAQIDQAKPILASFIKHLTDEGVKPEDAQAFAASYLKKRLPGNAGLTEKILTGLFSPVAIGAAIRAPADARTRVARQVAGLVD